MAIDFPNSPSPGATFTANSKTWTFTNGKWALNVSVGGVTGPAGVAIQGTAPATTDILWVDTSDTGLVIVPVGGTTGQVLAKSSGTDYATTWATPVTSGDMALKAPLASPTFTGTVSGVTKSMVGLGSVDDTADTAKPVSTAQQTALDLKASLASPVLTGTPTAPTATAATNTTQIATTAFVRTEVANLIASSPAALDTLDELAAALGDDANFATTTATAIGLKAPLASPTFTGTVTIPTGASITAPTGLVKGDVGLGNADNTSDVNKPVSTAQQTALNLKANLANPTFTGTVSGITATMVGLGNVTNTSDANKPVSTAQQTALDLKANIASPTFTGSASFPNITFDAASGTISSQGVGNFKTVVSNGRGVGISADPTNTSSILQFTNNAVSAQWASIVSTDGVLNLNASYTRVSTNLAIGNAATGYRLEVDGRARIRANAGGSAGIWYTNAAGTETVFGGLINDTTWGVYVSGDWRFSTTNTTFTVANVTDITLSGTNITLGGTGTNAVSIPYCAMLINRLWEGYPGIQVNNDTTYGGVGEFRVHGYGGISGGDFGVNFRIDGTYLTGSDMRMKTDISTIGGALDTVKNLRGVKYLRINRELDADIPDTSMTEGVKYGFIAQEIMEHAPEVVFQTPNHEPLENGWANEFAVDYGGLTPLLVEAIKELEARLSTLEGAQ